jgi:hypothetical protein
MAAKQVISRRNTQLPRLDIHYPDLVQGLADFAFHGMFPFNRGAFTFNGMTLVFGNDGYDDNDEDLRSRREVELFREILAEQNIKEIAFATSGDGCTWAMVLEGEYDGVHDAVASCWYQACDEIQGDGQTPVAS